jgi:VCBS repeat-containing protein
MPPPVFFNNDSDVDGDSMTVVLVTGPAHGTVTLDADGSFEYTPNDNFHGTDSFTYTVNDGYGPSAEATATITVNPVNDTPEVSDDSYPVLPDGVLNLNAASGVLANDSDVDGDSLDVTLVTGPAHGTLLIDADGAFQYTPDTGYEGSDSFTYQVNDGTVDSLVASVTLNVDTQAALADQAFAEEQDWA